MDENEQGEYEYPPDSLTYQVRKLRQSWFDLLEVTGFLDFCELILVKITDFMNWIRLTFSE